MRNWKDWTRASVKSRVSARPVAKLAATAVIQALAARSPLRTAARRWVASFRLA